MRHSIRMAILCGMAAFVITSCNTKSTESKPAMDMEKTKAEIQAMEDAYAAGEKAKDANAIAAYYSDDAISYMRNEEPAVGKAAIKERLAKRLDADTAGNTNVYKVVDVFADGDLLVEIGSWTEMNSAGAEVQKGHYMSCFQKRDGKYVCVRDMSVTSAPAKAPM